MVPMVAGLLVAGLVAGVRGYGSGAPKEKCGNMVPSHSGGLQTSASPFIIEVSDSAPVAGSPVTLKLRSGPSGTSFKGFLAQARDEAGKVLGSFEIISPADAQYLESSSQCGVQGTVTHRNNAGKSMVGLKWTPPVSFRGQATFFATFVQDYSHYWVKVPSAPLTVSASEAEPEPESEAEAEAEPEAEAGAEPEAEAGAEPEAEAGAEHEQHEEGAEHEQQEASPHYAACADTHSCFGLGHAGCLTKPGGCDLFASWSRLGEGFSFVLETAKGAAQYVGLGFSADTKMGEEMVLVCSAGKAELYWNTGKAPKLLGTIPADKVSSTDGRVMCSVSTGAVLRAGGREVDLRLALVPLLAGGSYGGAVSYHTPAGRVAAEKPVLLATVQNIGGRSDLLLQLHGVLMVVAWLGCGGTGMLLARFYKKTWVGRKISGKDPWFVIHRVLMMLTVTLSLLALVFAAVFLEGFDALEWHHVQANPHPATGLAVLVLALLNPVMAIFRPHPGTARRPIFNWAHWAVGNSAHILAVVTIFLASSAYSALSKDGSYNAWVYTMLAYVVFHVMMHVLLSVLHMKGEREAADHKEQDTAMQDRGGLGTVSPMAEKAAAPEEEPRSALRRALLLLYTISVLAFVCVLCAAIFSVFK